MSIKQAMVEISKGTDIRPSAFKAYGFATWCRRNKEEFSSLDAVSIIDALAERSEDYLEQEYARFILETSE